MTGGLPAGEVELDHAAREVTMSMTFKWYKGDFGPPEVMLPRLLQVSTSMPHRQLLRNCDSVSLAQEYAGIAWFSPTCMRSKMACQPNLALVEQLDSGNVPNSFMMP